MLRSLDRTLADMLLHKWFGEEAPLEELRRRRNEGMEEEMLLSPPKVKEGAIEGLRKLREKGYRLALVTQTPRERILPLLERAGLHNPFDEIVSAREARRGKPFPDPYLLALERTNSLPEECLAFEDAPAGALSAIRAGIRTYYVKDLDEPSPALRRLLTGVLDRLDEWELTEPPSRG